MTELFLKKIHFFQLTNYYNVTHLGDFYLFTVCLCEKTYTHNSPRRHEFDTFKDLKSILRIVLITDPWYNMLDPPVTLLQPRKLTFKSVVSYKQVICS